MKAPPRSVAVTVLVFAGFDLTCGLIGAAVLWWYYSQPFTIYTASYQPNDFRSIRIDKVSVYRFIVGLIIGGPIFGAAVGALVSVGVGISRSENTHDSV